MVGEGTLGREGAWLLLDVTSAAADAAPFLHHDAISTDLPVLPHLISPT